MEYIAVFLAGFGVGILFSTLFKDRMFKPKPKEQKEKSVNEIVQEKFQEIEKDVTQQHEYNKKSEWDRPLTDEQLKELKWREHTRISRVNPDLLAINSIGEDGRPIRKEVK